MMRRLVELSLRRPRVIALGLMLFVGAGLAALQSVTVEAFADPSDTQIHVVALHPGSAAEEVEKQVTLPIEIALTGLPGRVRLFSHTQDGLMFASITFDDSPGDLLARSQVLDSLRSVDLPAGVQIEVPPPATAIGELLRFRLRGDGYSPRDLRETQDWVVEKALRQVSGVADLVTLGGAIKQYEVHPDLTRLHDHKLSLNQLFHALQRANANVGGGAMSQGRQQFLVRSQGSFRSSADIERVVVAEVAGVPVLVRDVAAVRVGQGPAPGQAGQDSDDDIVSGVVVMRKGENMSAVLDRVLARIALLNLRGLPAGMKIIPYDDRGRLTDRTLNAVLKHLAASALLVSAGLFLLLRNWRAAAIVALVMPLSLWATLLGLSLAGLPVNLLGLGALDFGMLVGAAAVIAENVLRRLGELSPDQMQSRPERHQAVLRASREVARPIGVALLILIAAHLALFALQRHEGRIFAPMAWTLGSALLASLLLALSLVPLLCLQVLRQQRVPADRALLRVGKSAYTAALRWAIRRPKALLAATGLAVVGALALAGTLGSEFMPEADEATVWVKTRLPPSVSVDEARLTSARIRAQLRRIPEVAMVVSQVGRPDDGSDPKLFNAFEAFVELQPESQWRPGMSKPRLIAAMDESVSQLPGIAPSFTQPIRDKVLESLSQTDGQIVVKIKGDDPVVLAKLASQVAALARTTPGVQRAFVDRDGQLPQFKIEIDRDAAARAGLNVGDIQDVIAVALSGKPSSELWQGDRHFPVVLRLAAEQRNLASLAGLPVPTPSGSQVPLGLLAHISQSSAAMNIAREDGQRVASVGLFIRDRDMGSVVADLQSAVARELSLPAEVSLVWSGEFEQQQRAMQRLCWIVSLGLLLVFLLLLALFKNVRSALLIGAVVPFALIGGILALALGSVPLSVSAAVGFIVLFGQVLLNSLLLVSHYTQLREGGMALEDAVMQGSLTRLRPVLMTSLLAMAGLLPVALSHAVGTSTQRPLALVVIGGLVSATLLTLLVLPSLYVWAARRDPPGGLPQSGESTERAERSDLAKGVRS